MIKLRDYQVVGNAKIRQHWGNGKRAVCLREATGAGKSEMFADLAKDFPQQRILGLCHRRELVQQMAYHLADVLNEMVSIFEGGQHDMSCRAIAASVQSFEHLPPAFVPQGIGLIVGDECHHFPAEHYRHCLSLSPQAKVLGCTATPLHPSGEPLAGLFDCMVDGPQVRSLIDQGYLSDFELYSYPKPPSLSMVAAIWLAKSKQQQPTLIFAESVQQSADIAAQFQAAGITAAHIDAHTPHDLRDRYLQQLKAGELKVLSNFKILGEGVDIPAADLLVLLRKMSLSEYLQACGRVLRIYPDKPPAKILDFGENWRHHGLPDDIRRWSLDGHERFDKRRRASCYKCRRVTAFSPTSRGMLPCTGCGAGVLIH